MNQISTPHLHFMYEFITCFYKFCSYKFTKIISRNFNCLLFYSSLQTNQIRPFVFLENLRLGKLLLKLTDLYTQLEKIKSIIQPLCVCSWQEELVGASVHVEAAEAVLASPHPIVCLPSKRRRLARRRANTNHPNVIVDQLFLRTFSKCFLSNNRKETHTQY